MSKLKKIKYLIYFVFLFKIVNHIGLISLIIVNLFYIKQQNFNC